MLHKVINADAEVVGNLSSCCQGRAAAVLPALGIAFTQAKRFENGGSTFTMLHA